MEALRWIQKLNGRLPFLFKKRPRSNVYFFKWLIFSRVWLLQRFKRYRNRSWFVLAISCFLIILQWTHYTNTGVTPLKTSRISATKVPGNYFQASSQSRFEWPSASYAPSTALRDLFPTFPHLQLLQNILTSTCTSYPSFTNGETQVKKL